MLCVSSVVHVGACVLVCRANRLLLVKCFDNKMVKSTYNSVILLLTQAQVANQQQKKVNAKKLVYNFRTLHPSIFIELNFPLRGNP